MVSKDKYFFERIGKDNHQKEFFNFDTMSYCRKKPNGVFLSTIDAMTTLFNDGNDLDDYIENEIGNYEYRISYIYKKKEYNLIPVWNDYKLNAISKTHNGNVDFKSEIPNSMMTVIFNEVMNPASGFALRVMKSKDNSYALEDNNKKLVGFLASTRNKSIIGNYVKTFSNYHEFRKMYLNYKEYEEDTNKLGTELKKFYKKR